MHEIGDGNEGWEVGCLERPVPRLTIPEERPPRSLVKAAALGFSSHQRAELIAGNHAADTRPNQPLRTPLFPRLLCHWLHGRRLASGRRSDLGFPRNRRDFPGILRPATRGRVDLPHQLFDVHAVLKTGWQFRVRILLRRSAAHRHQAGVLRFLPGLIMHASLPFRPRHDPTAIRGDDRQTWCLGILRFESLRGMRGGLLFQMLSQLLPNHAAEIQDLRNADRQLGKLPQHLLRFVGGLVLRVGRDDLVHDRRAIASLIESQCWTLREKNLGDKPSNGRPVREVPSARQSSPKAAPDARADTADHRSGKAAVRRDVPPGPTPVAPSLLEPPLVPTHVLPLPKHETAHPSQGGLARRFPADRPAPKRSPTPVH